MCVCIYKQYKEKKQKVIRADGDAAAKFLQQDEMLGIPFREELVMKERRKVPSGCVSFRRQGKAVGTAA